MRAALSKLLDAGRYTVFAFIVLQINLPVCMQAWLYAGQRGQDDKSQRSSSDSPLMRLQVLNVAWAGHEIVSGYMDDMFAFFKRPAPEDYELQPMSGLTMPKAQLRAGSPPFMALWQPGHSGAHVGSVLNCERSHADAVQGHKPVLFYSVRCALDGAAGHHRWPQVTGAVVISLAQSGRSAHSSGL